MESKKRGRPNKFSKEMMIQMKATYSGMRADDRHLQNHLYQSFSYLVISRYHKENPIDNFVFLYKDEMHFKETVFTELGRTAEFITRYYEQEEANNYIINLAIQICNLAKEHDNKITSRMIERIVREDRKELKERIKNGE